MVYNTSTKLNEFSNELQPCFSLWLFWFRFWTWVYHRVNICDTRLVSNVLYLAPRSKCIWPPTNARLVPAGRGLSSCKHDLPFHYTSAASNPRLVQVFYPNFRVQWNSASEKQFTLVQCDHLHIRGKTGLGLFPCYHQKVVCGQGFKSQKCDLC